MGSLAEVDGVKVEGTALDLSRLPTEVITRRALSCVLFWCCFGCLIVPAGLVLR